VKDESKEEVEKEEVEKVEEMVDVSGIDVE
jgi:hypothetical protein